MVAPNKRHATGSCNESTSLLSEFPLIKTQTNPPNSGVTFEGKPHLTLGGVGRNLACAIELLGHRPVFITSLARDDNLSDFALTELAKFGLDLESHRLKINWAQQNQDQPEPPSACFALVLVDSISGQCEYVIADLKLNESLDRTSLQQLEVLDQIREAPLVVLDANLPSKTIDFLVEFCNQNEVPIFLEPTDVVCLKRLAECLAGREQKGTSNKSLAFLSPNVIELTEMMVYFEAFKTDGEQSMAKHSNDLPIEQIELMGKKLMTDHLPDLKCLLVTMDRRGSLVVTRQHQTSAERDIDQIKLMRELKDEGTREATVIRSKYYETPRLVENPVSVSGAGDSFASGFISGLLGDCSLIECLRKGFNAAYSSLLSKDTIPKSLREL